MTGLGRRASVRSWLALVTGISSKTLLFGLSLCGCLGLLRTLRRMGKALFEQPPGYKMCHTGAHRIADRFEPQKGGNLLASARCATKVQQAFVLHRELMYSCVAQGDAKGRVTLELRHGKPVFLHGTAHDGNSPGAVVRKAELFHLCCDHGIAWCRQRASQIVQTKTAMQAARVVV